MIVIDASQFIVDVFFYAFLKKGKQQQAWLVVKRLHDLVYITAAQEQEIKPALALGTNKINSITKGPVFIGGTLAFVHQANETELFRIFATKSMNPQDFPIFTIRQYGMSEMSPTALKIIDIFNIKISSFNIEASTSNNMPLLIQRFIAEDLQTQIIETAGVSKETLYENITKVIDDTEPIKMSSLVRNKTIGA